MTMYGSTDGTAARLVFVTGAARSGKSRYAEELAASFGKPVLYVATAEALDDEMRRRVELHRVRRPDGWETLEARRGIYEGLRHEDPTGRTVLLDCVSLLVSNLLLDAVGRVGEDSPELASSVWGEVTEELEALVRLLAENGADCICVSNEVGWGVVPPHRLGRVYRDLLGRTNQLVASHATDAALIVAGMPLVLKGDLPS